MEDVETPIKRIVSMAGGIQKTVMRLEGLARVLSTDQDRQEPESAASDIGHVMELFALHLAAINDGLDDILGNAEDLMKPTLHAV